MDEGKGIRVGPQQHKAAARITQRRPAALVSRQAVQPLVVGKDWNATGPGTSKR